YFRSLQAQFKALQLLKEIDIETYEGDIRLHERFLMERFIHAGFEFTGELIKPETSSYREYQQVKIRTCDYQPQNHKISTASIDIECSLYGELYSIGIDYISTDKKQQIVLMIGDAKQHPESEPYIHWLADEKALISQFCLKLCQLDPDIIIGWNVINFDWKLLLKRAQLHGVAMNVGRDKSPARWRNHAKEVNQGFIHIAGRVVIDGIDALKQATYSFPSFSLDHVANALLHKGKAIDHVDNRVDEINHDFHHNKPKLANYNLQDCILVSEIFVKTQILDFLIFRSQLTGLAIDRMGGSVAAFTNLYLPQLHRAAYIAPNLPKDGGLASPGGYVMSSKPGLYKNVLVLDFKSLYPAIICTFKVDPMGLIEGLKNPDTAIEGFKDALFSREQHFLPDIIEDLWSQRDKAKRDKDTARSTAIKLIMNSFYGVLGSGGCRFYDTRLASSITLRGHHIMQQTARWIEQQGFEVIYGDTDSTFVLLDENLSAIEAQRIGKQLAEKINQQWSKKLQQDYQLASYLEIEFETHYSRFFMPTIRGAETGSKKRYAGLIKHSDKEEIIFKGLESVRSDWTTLAQDFQKTLFQHVFHDQNPSQYILQTVKSLTAGELDGQLIYRKRLRQKLSLYQKNIPPHVKAALKADAINQQSGKPLQYQDKGTISYVMTTAGAEAIEYQ
ncbi:MAG: DNA polymerase II, partial [Pseudomonadales bacterium]|nr:DNA polymerase II [Pseudomonadales bacterium]